MEIVIFLTVIGVFVYLNRKGGGDVHRGYDMNSPYDATFHPEHPINMMETHRDD